jgi:hypothetical protein
MEILAVVCIYNIEQGDAAPGMACPIAGVAEHAGKFFGVIDNDQENTLAFVSDDAVVLCGGLSTHSR